MCATGITLSKVECQQKPGANGMALCFQLDEVGGQAAPEWGQRSEERLPGGREQEGASVLEARSTHEAKGLNFVYFAITG